MTRPVQPSFEECTRVDTWRSVTLEVDDVAFLLTFLAPEEVIETHLVKRGCGGVRRDVAADAALFAVGTHNHRQCVPAHEAADALFDISIARV